eukprot:4575114-Alexandrium_andersonii.AAC.1
MPNGRARPAGRSPLQLLDLGSRPGPNTQRGSAPSPAWPPSSRSPLACGAWEASRTAARPALPRPQAYRSGRPPTCA